MARQPLLRGARLRVIPGGFALVADRLRLELTGYALLHATAPPRNAAAEASLRAAVAKEAQELGFISHSGDDGPVPLSTTGTVLAAHPELLRQAEWRAGLGDAGKAPEEGPEMAETSAEPEVPDDDDGLEFGM